MNPAVMAVCTRFRPFLGLVGFMSLIIFSFYQLDILQIKTEKIYHRQECRKQQLREMCDRVKKDFPKWNRNIDHMSKEELKNFIVDDKHGVIYCYIPKVASSNWKRVMLALRYGEPYRDPMSINASNVHESTMIKYLKSNPRAELKAKLKHYTKFLFVRDPFVRLISAYRNKFQQYKKPFYDLYGRLMLLRYGNHPNPPKTEKEVLASGVRPSFHNFIQYLLDPKTARPLEPHWRQMYQMCHPCLIQYDLIGHQETLREDAEQLLKILKLENDIKFPLSLKSMTTQDFVLDWFKAVSIEERRKLYQMYEMDFKLFGYPKPVELLDG